MCAEVLRCEDVKHTFGSGELADHVLCGVSASFSAGETSVLMGPSGSGKTTLLSILGCMIRPTEGELRFHGQIVNWRSESRLTAFRKTSLGFVFQDAQLLPFLSVIENLQLIGHNTGMNKAEVKTRIDSLLDRLGIANCRQRMPGHLSGGQRQRVAIARALLHRPAIILADEPTAALDWEHGREVIGLLVGQAREERAMLLTVTHDTRLVPYFDRLLGIEQGLLSEKKP